jgi:MSHA biogenesis protein MshM
MYQQHFGLQELPFSLTPDTGYFFPYGHYSEAMNTLLVALRSGEGFIKVVGEVGTGKTLLCRKLLNTLDRNFATAYIPNPYLTPYGLHIAVAEELGIPLPGRVGRHQLLKLITYRLVELTQKGRKVVLCLDEAQGMPLETLEALRLLTNLETEKYKLLQVVLFGQPELDTRLNHPSVRQLKQRITFSFELRPIDLTGMQDYMLYRLKIAGFRGALPFQPRALQMLYHASHGIPRLINILCHKAMMVAYGRGTSSVARDHVMLAVKDTDAAQVSRSPRPRYMIAAAAILIGLVVGVGILIQTQLR